MEGMQQIVGMSIPEFFEMAAEVAAKISTIEDLSQKSVIIEKVDGKIKISIEKKQDVDILVWRKKRDYDFNEKQQEINALYMQNPETRECPDCGSVMRRRIDRRYAVPVWYVCEKCKTHIVFSPR